MATRTHARFDGFDVIRIVAALMVVFDHSYGITGHRGPSTHIGRYALDAGHVGVIIFFVTSGFLVAQSWQRDPRGLRFGRRRFARIWPALAVLVVVSVFVMGPLVTVFTRNNYFHSEFTWDYLWNMTLVARIHFRLPGVFDGQPSQAVNGSLWTLPYEAWAYVGLATLGVLGILRRRVVVAIAAAVLLVVFQLVVIERSIDAPYALLGITQRSAIHLGTYFLIGTALAAFHEYLDALTMTIAGAVLIAASVLLKEPVLFVLGLSFAVVGIGLVSARAIEYVHRLGDPSYGTYIFSFPTQQLLVFSGFTPAPLVFFAVAGPLSLALGYGSWWAIERPAMRFLRPRPRVPAVLDPADVEPESDNGAADRPAGRDPDTAVGTAAGVQGGPGR